MAKNLLNKEVTPEIKNVIDKNTILVIKYKEENKKEERVWIAVLIFAGCISVFIRAREECIA
jgi:hypothetical protein